MYDIWCLPVVEPIALAKVSLISVMLDDDEVCMRLLSSNVVVYDD